MTKRKTRIVLSSFIVIALGLFLYILSISTTGFKIEKTVYIKIDETKSYDSVLQQIADSAHVESLLNFKAVASFLGYPDGIRSGRYEITPDMSVLEVVHLLKSGRQAPVKLKFNNIRTKNDLAERLSQQLMVSKEAIMNELIDPIVCQKYGFTTDNIVSMFVPNTYEVYWNIPLDKLMTRMQVEHEKFWNTDRKAKAQALNLSPSEVSVLASIVEEECYYNDEYPVVAGLYLNRLNKNMLLQADPTVKFAVNDFTLRRILNKHLVVDSPYNTYKFGGLPVGPIRVPSIKAIDGVLNYSHHNYLFMCAKEDFSNRHNFASNYAAHQINAAKYQKALNERNIYR